ncbi:hypothetical protein PG994_008032 [Apiospora phragmitis]|uniref:Glycosyltransferase family 25 protein n=1 Tax=Apiospora phragmitis TaxID=2905665 RepID=A0ABR1URW6_9PEZI
MLLISRPARTDRRDAMVLAAAVSNLTFEWVDGVDGDTVEERVLPPGDRPKHKSSDTAVRGSWRAHMNALRKVVEEGLPSALIMEDDVDWDLRIKSQLQTFGAASNAWLRTTSDMKSKPLVGLSEADPLVTYRPRRSGAEARGSTGAVGREDVERYSVLLDHQHCGTEFPNAGTSLPPPPLRVVVPDDPTVPAPRHLKPHPFASHDALGELYPPHTRVVHATTSPGTACTLAYAVSQRGARKLLWQFGLEDFSSQWDLMLGSWCAGGYVGGKTQDENIKNDDNDKPPAGGTSGTTDGVDNETSSNERRRDGSNRRRISRQHPTCLTVQPPIFGHYFAKKGASDIRGQGGGYVTKVGTPYVRWSVRMNLNVLTEGGTAADVVDQLPDKGEAMW